MHKTIDIGTGPAIIPPLCEEGLWSRVLIAFSVRGVVPDNRAFVRVVEVLERVFRNPEQDVAHRALRMRVGLQTISWGVRIADMDALLKGAKQLGFEGIEFAQTVHSLGSAAQLRSMLESNDLRPIGLAGGALQDRIDYATILRPCYLYTDEWDESGVGLALQKGITVGLHPHYYKDMATVATAEVYLKQFPQLGLILDTAHLYLANDDIMAALRRHGDRVLAVHLKDWTGQYGTYPHRFARGFKALGEGELGALLEEVVDYLVESAYGGWVIVEQDIPDGSAFRCAEVSRRWLENHGV